MTSSSLLPPLPAMMDNYRKQHAKPAIPTFVSPQSCSTHSAHVYYNLLPKSIEYVYKTGQKVMGRTSIRLGKLLPGSPEDIRFCGSFGVSAKVAKTTWELMEEHGLRPPGSDFLYFLWALAFMQTYPPNDNTLSRVLGRHDPKTISKNMASHQVNLLLNDVVVS
jgi:hypothetical protein